MLYNNLPFRCIEFTQNVKELIPLGTKEIWLFRFNIFQIGYYYSMQLYMEMDDTKTTLIEISDNEDHFNIINNIENNSEKIRLIKELVLSLLKNRQKDLIQIELQNSIR